MTTNATQKKKGGNKGTAAQAPAAPIANPVLPADRKLIVTGALATLEADRTIEPATGLSLIRVNEAVATIPALAAFPLGYSAKTHMLSGKLMNISMYCRRETGKAWNEKHAATVLANEKVKLHVLKDQEIRTRLSAELDAMRPKFYDTCKVAAATFNARKDVEVRSARIRQTKAGIVFTTQSVLPTAGASEIDQLRKQLAESQLLAAALQAKVGTKVSKKVKQQLAKAGPDNALDVPATVTKLETVHETAATSQPAQGGTPTPATANVQ